MSLIVQNPLLELSPLRILIIDDSLSDVQQLQSLLSSPVLRSALSPFTIRHAQKAVEGLGQYLDYMPDCVLIGHSPPNMNGLDLVRSLQSLRKEVKATLVIMTQIPDDDLAQQAMQLGIQGCLSKSELTEQQLSWSIYHAQERANFYRKLTSKQDELNRFAGTAAHDIITPLSNLSLFVEHVQEKFGNDIDEDILENFGAIVSIVEHMTSLMEGLSTYAQMGGGHTLYSYVDLQRLYEYILLLFDYELDTVNAVITADTLPTIYGNQVGLSQLLQNLIGNAIKYRSKERLEIEIRVSEANGCLHLRVSDNGIGIEPEYHSEIFAPFQRLHSRAEYPGSGLGLATCQRVVDQHDGRIWVESVLGKGTTVHVLLPSDLPSHHDLAELENDDESMIPGHDYPEIDWDALLEEDNEAIVARLSLLV